MELDFFGLAKRETPAEALNTHIYGEAHKSTPLMHTMHPPTTSTPATTSPKQLRSHTKHILKQ